MSILRTKSVERSIAETDDPDFKLKKKLSALDLTVFGIGVIIGAGIFTVTGRAAATLAGPAIVVSFVIGAICCGLAALCYAEFASTVPVSGSAYTFSYATMGEFVAWIIGWDLLLELLLAAAVVAQGWSQYVVVLLGKFGLSVPASVAPGSSFDLPAVLLVLVLTALIAIGIKESLRVNMVLVFVKIAIVLFVIFAGIAYIKPGNWTPFIPEPVATPTEGVRFLDTPLIQIMTGMTPQAYGLMGIVSAAALVFFAYIGFDVVATTAEEARNPARDLPKGIIYSLVICTVLYIAVCLVITGMVPYDQLNPKAALATAFADVGMGWAATVIAAGAVAGLTTVVMTLMIGSTRVLFAMSRDNLIPGFIGKTNPKTGTPMRLTLGIGVLVALIAGFTPIGKLEEMVNIGTLSAFALVCIGVPILRRTRPDIPRAFKVPGSPVLPLLAALVCVYLMLNLSLYTWARFFGWMAIGFVLYFAYGMWFSRLRREQLAEGGDYAHVDRDKAPESEGPRMMS